MKLGEKAGNLYGKENVGCGVSICIAARERLGVNITDGEAMMLYGFNGGMGCKATCGALSAGIAVLGKKYADRENVREICAGFVEAFKKGIELDTIECGVIEAKYRTEADRCLATVVKTGNILEEYINKLEGKTEDNKAAEDGCTLAPEDIKRVKGEGFLHQKGTNKFNARIITRNGKITSEEARMMAETSKKYGDGHMMLTTRLTMEISGIEYENIEAFKADVAKAGMVTGGTGSKVRPVVSCKGTTCQYGNIDTYALSDKIHNIFYVGYHGVSLPHKFKIAVGGCPNNCVKPNLNDFGIIGVNVPQYDADKCKNCKKCKIVDACPIKAASIVDGKCVIDPEKCNNCGRCISKCPFNCADEGKQGWKIYIGGRWGKMVAHGKMINKIFTSEDEVLETIEKAILLFRSEGISGERFADTVDRLGFEYVEAKLLSNELLEKKSEILGINVVGGASC